MALRVIWLLALLVAPACQQHQSVSPEQLQRFHRIPFVERDVEEDPGAQADSDRALARAGLVSTHTLPVVDVRGTVMIGFMPCIVEAAWPGA